MVDGFADVFGADIGAGGEIGYGSFILEKLPNLCNISVPKEN